MQSFRNVMLSYLRIPVAVKTRNVSGKYGFTQLMRLCTSIDHDQVMERVIGLVKKFDKIDAPKVTGTADFQKDLSIDSLDRVELVMAFEEEFSITIPDEEGDKLKCCADVAKYVVSSLSSKSSESS